jgi:hypothetical protein
MDMIGHQAIRPDLCPGLVGRLAEQVAVERVVDILEKGLAASIAALGDVVRHPGDHDSCQARHPSYLASCS